MVGEEDAGYNKIEHLSSRCFPSNQRDRVWVDIALAEQELGLGLRL